MKPTHKILLGLVAASAWLIAGNVTIPNSFTANTTAKASEVNANFSAVKTAVDGNAGDITSNANDIATNKADITTNATNIAAAVTDITVGNGLDANRTGNIIEIKKTNGYVAVHGSAFTTYTNTDNDCVLVRDYWFGNGVGGTYFHKPAQIANCKAYASVDIPNNANITKLTCRVMHNDNKDDLYIRLSMQNRTYTFGTTGDIQYVKLIEATLASTSTSAATQEISGTYTPGLALFNPTYKSYFIEWDPPETGVVGNTEAIFDCKVDYEY